MNFLFKTIEMYVTMMADKVLCGNIALPSGKTDLVIMCSARRENAFPAIKTEILTQGFEK